CGVFLWCLFFFQAEDGIRVKLVTGVQTCALPISSVVSLLVAGSGIGWLVLAGGLILSAVIWASIRSHKCPKDGSWLLIDEELIRSEEHTSELQSLAYLVCRLLLEKKKN